MEKLLQYMWQHRLWKAGPLATADGEPVEVLDPGVLNTDAGPDFFNAKVRIGSRLWAGNVEIHVCASDWYRHGHQTDRNYDTVVLHAVAKSDCDVRRPDGSVIPQIVLPDTDDFCRRYKALVSNARQVPPCASALRNLAPIYVADWITSLAMQRIQRKADRIAELAEAANGDWQQALYVTLARTLGFHTNSEAFERLAAAMPLKKLRRHRDYPEIVQGMLFGHAGFLDTTPESAVDAAYVECLRRHYRFMTHKFNIGTPPNLGWRMARMRPYHFPTRSLAALAQFVCNGFKPGYMVWELETLEQARELFDIELEGYWARRFGFGPETSRSSKAFSRASIDVLVVNVAVPAIYAYGMAYGREEMMARAVDFLARMAPESNRKVRMFTDAGLRCPDAFTSQALVELSSSFCEVRKCLFCRLGHQFLAKPTRTP